MFRDFRPSRDRDRYRLRFPAEFDRGKRKTIKNLNVRARATSRGRRCLIPVALQYIVGSDGDRVRALTEQISPFVYKLKDRWFMYTYYERFLHFRPECSHVPANLCQSSTHYAIATELFLPGLTRLNQKHASYIVKRQSGDTVKVAFPSTEELPNRV